MPHHVVKRIREQGYVTKYKPDQISHYFRRMQQRIGLEDVYNFHSTRHYCVSTLHANGLPDAYIMERGGWATTDVLNYVYRHTFSSQSAALTDRALNHFESVTKFVTKRVVIIEKLIANVGIVSQKCVKKAPRHQ